MKVTQDLIIFDLEATSSKNENGYQENKNIIQIGAVYLRKKLNKSYEIIDLFDQLVKPKNESISNFIEKLTGISNEDVQDEEHFDVVGNNFKEWAAQYGNIKSARLCAWGTYFDVPLLRRHYEEYKMTYPFSGSAYDIKTLAYLWLMLQGKRSEKLSLLKVAEFMNLDFQGKIHNASVDTLLTARIAMRIFSDLDREVSGDNRYHNTMDIVQKL